MTGQTRITAAEIARRCGVGLPAVSNWRSRHADFPVGMAGPSGETYPVVEVLAWLKRRAVPTTKLRPSELEGLSYADRFADVGSVEATPMIGRTERHAGQPRDQRRVVKDLLRDIPSSDPTTEILLGLVAVRLRAPDAFAALQAADSRGQIDQLAALTATTFAGLFPDPGHEPVDAASLSRAVDAVARTALPDPGDRVSTARLALQLIELRAEALGRTGDHLTPGGLVELMVGVTRAGSAGSVHDPFTRSGELLIGAAIGRPENGQPPPRFSAVSVTAAARRSTLSALLVAGLDGEVRTDRMLSDRGDETYDVVLANPPFSLRLSDSPPGGDRWRYGFPGQSGNYAWLQHVLAMLGPDGRAAVLMANHAGTSDRVVERTIRAAMLVDGVVDAVVALPDRLFPSTSIAPSLWLLRRPPSRPAPDVLLVDATGMGRVERRSRILTSDDIARIRGACLDRHAVPGFSALVPAAELADSRIGLHPPAYVGDRAPLAEVDPDRVRRAFDERGTSLTVVRERVRATDSVRSGVDVARSTDLRSTSIAEACDVRTGPGRFDDVSGAPTIPVVLPRSIRHNRIYADTGEAAPGAAQAVHYRLETGDVVGIRVGQLGSYGLVRPHQDGWLLGPGCLRIRPGRDIDPGYLASVLGSAAARDWLDRHATGSAVRGISARVLGDMPLVLPSLAEQRRISAVLTALDDEIEALEQAADATVGARAAAAEQLIAGFDLRAGGSSTGDSAAPRAGGRVT